MKLLLKLFLILLSPVYCTAQVSPLFLEPTKADVDSLRIILEQTKNDTIKMAIYREFALYYLDINSDSALYFIEQELPYAKNLKLKIWEADALDLQGLILDNLGNYPGSLQSFLESIKIAEDKETEKNTWHISKFTNGKDPRIGRLTMLSTIYLDFSGLYRSTGNTEKGEFYIRKSIKIATQLKDYTILSLASNRLGQLYYDKGNSDTALIYFQNALSYIDVCGYKKYKGATLNSLGQIYFDKQDYQKAKLYYASSLLSSDEQNNKAELGKTNILLSQLYLTTGNLDSSYYYAKTGESIVLKTGRLDNILLVYTQLSRILKLQNKPDSALYYLESAVAVNDSLNNSEKVKQFQNIGFDEQIKLQELEREKIQMQNKIRTYSLLAGLIVFLFIAFLLYRNNQKEKKAKSLLQKKNKEIETTLLELKSTQSQLIQSEKMASLGELTAGIAHEIQNPLNFVNNFSEVSTDLIEELHEELIKGDTEEVSAIAKDLLQNLEKITHHGKRASFIVNGMLEHSRTSSGEKTATDINVLAEEFLKLSYHGLRAKDKSFNAEFKTKFDEELPLINVVSQDVGRVILNLINNAFYAVDKKAKKAIEGYKPEVVISTKKLENSIEISVTDNGDGIPDSIKEKIFQPFFTTKPTGEGTGLGLSLSYDIITKGHNGKMKVETIPDQGSEFIIQLPI